jgi:hypothetical protein
VRDLSLVDPLTVMAEPALLSLARTALRSRTAPAVEGGQATARLAVWWPGEDLKMSATSPLDVPAGMRPAMRDRGVAGERPACPGCCRWQRGA